MYMTLYTYATYMYSMYVHTYMSHTCMYVCTFVYIQSMRPRG